MNNIDSSERMVLNDPNTKPPFPGWIWFKGSWQPPRLAPINSGSYQPDPRHWIRGGNGTIRDGSGRTKTVYITPGGAVETPPIGVIPPVEGTGTTTGSTTTGAATDDLIWGYPKNYLYLAGAGVAVVAVVVIYLATKK